MRTITNVRSLVLLSFWLVGLTHLTFAQSSIRGKVTTLDEGEGLPGVNVVLQGTSVGTVTDVEGNYSLEAPTDGVLVFSSVGYTQEEVPINGRSIIDLTMAPDIQSLSEVVVVGYGVAKKSDLTGAVSSVDPEQINNQVLPNAAEGLRGQSAGVFVSSRSSQPGGGLNIRIRGTNSIAAGNNPLYVVDGVPLAGDISGINPADIESIEVLKDASAQAVYGARGAGGVILVTTKKGRAGQTNINFESYWGVAEQNLDLDLMTTRQSAELLNAAALNDDLPPFFTESEIQQLPEYDWIDLTTRSGTIQNYTLSISGGNQTTRYSVSGNYFDQEGVMLNTGFNRSNLKLSIDSDVSQRLTLSTNINLSRTNRNNIFEGGEESGILLSVAAWPFTPPYDEEGNYTDFTTALPNYPSSMVNPLPQLLERDVDNITTRIIGNVALNYEIFPSLSYRLVFGADVSFDNFSTYQTSRFPNNPAGRSFITRRNGQFYTNQNILTWNQDFGLHNLTATGVFEWTQSMRESVNNSATGFFTDELSYNYINIAQSQNPATQTNTEYQIASYMGRVNYSFNDRYLLTASMRADGSSRFGTGNRWGIFPSAAAAWKVSEEEFIQQAGLFSNLKLRAGWGQVGNQSFASYQSIVQLETITTAMGNQPVIGANPANLPNRELRWETTTSTNIGLDVGFLNQRLTFTTEFYVKNTDDLLAFVPVAQSTGFSSVISNIGKIQNRGWEFDAYALIFDGDFQWDVNANITYNRNEVLELAGGSDIFGPELAKPLGQMHVVREGLPFPSILAFEEEDQLDEEGRVVVKDINNDGVINLDDRTIQGTPNPDFYYGLTTNLRYKGFELSLLFQGVSGNEIISGTVAQLSREPFFRGHRPQEMYENRWTPENPNPNPNAEWPRMDELTRNLVDVGTERFVLDGSYVRLKNIRLTYNIPTGPIKWLRSASVYVSADNLLTFTNYPWFDPEVSTVENPGGNVQQRIAQGVDLGAYPNSTRFIGGFRIGF
ncbi:SusC/RagA family TonB-linked outer membrane protein [Tunicatimonas pelagia]|uniref:SusC/RagA family TonB-linked outer membrane protein n=1 Tax=Tunicatimonas pelagia TaxID=931531 RepID=UPI0026660C63|nr:TonB-dependent receptor [Tunicatimonas pelagia]WKN42781.1 TonB-dependent receptor [Tunicatimonas pelagia]